MSLLPDTSCSVSSLANGLSPVWKGYPLVLWLPSPEALSLAWQHHQSTLGWCAEQFPESLLLQESVGWVYHRVSDYFYVWTVFQGQVYPVVCKQRANLKKAGLTPTIGDWVRLEGVTWGHPEGQYEGWIQERLTRRTHLLRPHVSNMDVIALVVSFEAPAFSLRQLTRQLADIHVRLKHSSTVAFSDHGQISTAEASVSEGVVQVEVVLLLSKQDLFYALPLALQSRIQDTLKYLQEAFPALRIVWLDPYTAMPSHEIDTLQPELRALFSGKVCALVGESGVGKTTLLNMLDPTLMLKTSDVSDKIARGRHTTRTTSLLPLKGVGGWWMDTPGFSQLSFEGLDPQLLLETGFPELHPKRQGCQFPDCLHEGEEGCALGEGTAEIPQSVTPEVLPLAPIETGLSYRPKRRHFVAHKKRETSGMQQAFGSDEPLPSLGMMPCEKERLLLWHDMLRESRQCDHWEKRQQDKKGFEGVKTLGKGEDTRVKLRQKQRETSRRKQSQMLRGFHGVWSSESLSE
ncbi:MAG: ribosome small subunit-dependent GTPase A [Vampirovibrionales bacterium]